MALKDILAILRSSECKGATLALAEQLAAEHDAYLRALVVEWTPAVPAFTENWVVDPGWAELVRTSQQDLEKARETLTARLARQADHWLVDGLFADIGDARSELEPYPRHVDLTLVTRPDRDAGSLGGEMLIETALFASGRPVLVVPPDWKPTPIGRKAFVAWNSGRESARALGDALVLLKPESEVVVATIDAKPSLKRHGDWPGVDIAAHLARHKLKAELKNVDSRGRGLAKTICEEAVAIGADLIVMGGYGRSRLSEFVFGGATREMLWTSPLPLLMAH